MFESLLCKRPSSSFTGYATAAPYRYYRMNISGRNSTTALAVGEWELLDSSGANRALGMPATASDQGASPAAGAFDGNVPTTLSNPHWQTNQAGAQWLSVDLGAPVLITKFALYADISSVTSYADYGPSAWTFEGSNDGATWDTIAKVQGYSVAIWKARRQHIWDVELKDSSFDNVSLLLALDNFVLDTSNRQKTITPVGSLTYTASTGKYGSAINFGTNGSASNRLDITPHTDLAFGAGDFTIEMDLYLTQYSGQWGTFLYDGRNSSASNSAPFISITPAGLLQVGFKGTNVVASSVTVPINAWNKIGVQRKNNVWELYINNKLVGSATNNISLVCDNTVRVSQAYNSATSTTICGLVDNLRVTKGLARLVDNYPVLNRSFPIH